MFRRMARHSAITAEMASKVGYDIPAALESGTLDEEQLRGMVQRCSRCSNPEECVASMAHSTEVPEFCENRWFFTAEESED